MKKRLFISLLAAVSFLPLMAQNETMPADTLSANRQQTESRDELAQSMPRCEGGRPEVNDKVVKNRNIMLNESSISQPKQISIGLPLTISSSIFEDGMPTAYYPWPYLPSFNWHSGNAEKHLRHPIPVPLYLGTGLYLPGI